MITPAHDEFVKLAERGNLIPVYRELPADLETPVSVFLKLRGEGAAFLLESVEKGEQQGRYSFLGIDLQRQIVARHGVVTVHNPGNRTEITLADDEDALTLVERELARFTPVEVAGLPPFHGGAVGFFGYDLIAAFEPVLAFERDEAQRMAEMHLLLTDTLLIFDHVKHRLLVVANAHLTDEADPTLAYEAAVRDIEALVERLQRPLPALPHAPGRADTTWQPSIRRDEFEANVRAAKEHIAAGDIFQVVLSQRLTRDTEADPFTIYRTLRRINPSPYMFYFHFPPHDDRDELMTIIGASPEMMVRLEGRTATVRPIAGTRPRGATRAEDERLAQELYADPKERAEHVMLVDLGRNDMGRAADYGSVEVTDFMITERYS
ncbi:MAG: chorismate-binding protein, partial [Ardenticatenales bacterium]|nr:chorismate-binding protein [Ardenticatenales bacterium]